MKLSISPPPPHIFDESLIPTKKQAVHTVKSYAYGAKRPCFRVLYDLFISPANLFQPASGSAPEPIFIVNLYIKAKHKKPWRITAVKSLLACECRSGEQSTDIKQSGTMPRNKRMPR
jgi:hypothetical protein